ncbi:hypothetical protein Tsubulata_005808 [Turnera subulata]|uniref:Membrane insertase YidC/Oxa/ALB C-terminal domain-containing protein n=1 Tax=Turnera subulata TaxID=218843 RepID=A0A9Q0JNM3_9ROSI|nr:hypothetical protein Tsubulata_005808 [Turnera subulata]
MAFMRSLSIRASTLRRQRNPSFAYVLHDHDRDRKSVDDSGPSRQPLGGLLQQQRSFGSRVVNSSAPFGFSRPGICADFYHASPSIGASFCRNMSTTVDGGADKIELMSDVADVLTDATVQSVAAVVPAANEVAIAAADSFFPVAGLQYFIDFVHTTSGLNWWASIVAATLLIRTATIPISINTLKSTAKLSLMRPHLEEIKQKMGDQVLTMTEGQQQMKELFNRFGVHPLTPLKGLFFQGPIFVSFFLAISNMAEKVPSFKTGGAWWFLDLSTPDSLYILPILTGLTFLITVEANMQEGMEGNPAAGPMKIFSRVFALVSIPLTMNFPKAVLCYWVTSNVFSLVYGLALKVPGVKKALGVPEIPVAPAGTSQKSSFDMLSALKKELAARQAAASSSPIEPPPQVADQKKSSSAVLSQRIRSLEKQVKGRKKNKKR